MSLPLALSYMERLGVRECTVTPDFDPLFWKIDTDREITSGAARTLVNRMRLAILDHKHALSEPASVLSEQWTIKRTDGGGVFPTHPSCRLLSLPRYKASAA